MKRIKVLLFVAFMLSFSSQIAAQNEGNVTIHQSDLANQLIKKHIKINKEMSGIPGYRVQIFSDSGNNSKSEARKAKAEFLKNNSDYNAYIVFEAPYYKVEIGDFIKRLKAEKCLKKVKDEYPGAFIISEPEMAIPEL